MKIRAFKYFSPVIVYVLSILAFGGRGIVCWLPMLYAWVILPLAELFIKPDAGNLDAAEEEMVKNDRFYDYILYAIVPLQFVALYFFFTSVTNEGLLWWEIAGKVWTMGLLCGSFGINVAHELGHRSNVVETFLAKALLMTSLYMHFHIEHNKGHHKNVATPGDPASARYNEPIYLFYFRTVIFSYLSAWKIANKEASIMSLRNEMLQAHIIQLMFAGAIWFIFGWMVTACFLCAALIGIALLETVNYIEHYGLQRKKNAEGKFERAMPQHSWNSNHILGRIMLFELSRHSDHHYLASRKYQVLKHHDDAPQLPTGYPGSMLLALFPPAWFYVMNKKLRKLKSCDPGSISAYLEK